MSTKHHKFAKPKRAENDPVSPPPAHPAFIPLPPRPAGDLTLDLETVLPGINEHVKTYGKLVFHTVGDTGGIHGTDTQDRIAAAMQHQIENSGPDERPAFFYHLGDVVYFNGQAEDYQNQFYEPYQHLDYPIFAVPGNHDGGGDPKLWSKDGHNSGTDHPLSAFMDNFCSARPRHLFKHRTTMVQPYCYWTLVTPAGNIIGLYSNVDGHLDAPGGRPAQREWLDNAIRTSIRRPIICLHHPAYSLDKNHGGYPAIAEALESIELPGYQQAVFSGHVHNYQRFSRGGVPYVIAGAGGYANGPRSMHRVPDGEKETTRAGVTLERVNCIDPGFCRVIVTFTGITIEYWTVPFDASAMNPKAEPKLFDTVSV
jgi:predicted phosphodiesterase